jgi:hypothetical protein
VFNVFKKILIIASLSLATVTTVTIISNEINSDAEQPSYIESIKLDSSRYTKPDDLSIVDPELFIDIKTKDALVAENDNLRLYYNEEIVSFKIENKNTGYVFSTNIDRVSAGTYGPLLSGGIGIEYIQVTKSMNIVENIGITDIAFTSEQVAIENGIKISLSLGGFCSSRFCKSMYPGYLEGRFTLEDIQAYGYSELGMGFDLIVTLEEDGIKAVIPYESITEVQTDVILLSSIILFPGLGATKLDEIPGYMMIPDGAGVLVRYEDNEGRYKSPYRAQIYGINYGLRDNFQTVSNYTLSMPIFGMVHGVNQNGLLAIIEGGDYSSRLFMFHNGAHNLDYNLVFPKFDIRKTFRQSFTSDGAGGAIRYTDTSTSDIEVLYKVLENEEANYVGMANKYSEYLDSLETFSAYPDSTDIPINLNYLMADSKNALFGTKTIEMSTVDDLYTMHDYFLSQGLQNFNTTLMGWNDGGYSGNLPSSIDFDRALGTKRSFADLIAYLQETSEVSLINNYLVGAKNADSILVRRDVAKGVDRFRLTWECDICVYDTASLLYPSTSYRLAEDHLADYQDLNVNVLFQMLGNTLFSYYDSGYYSREDAVLQYLEIMEMYDGLANYNYPNAYAFKYASAYMGAPMFNSQLKYFDDLVPVLQIALMGKIPMFSDYLNFNSYGQDFLLQLVDFNVYPAYVLTMNESSKLKDTDIEYIYTSEFDLWKDTVVEEYNFINNALKHVIGESLTAREVVELGVVKNTYSNGVIIYINYTSKNKIVDGVTVEAINYALGGEYNG